MTTNLSPQQAIAPAVLIAGAGPTGLTLACELARRDIPFRLVEAAAGPQPGSRGKGIQPRSLEVFDDLGIVERVLANGRSAMPIRTIGPDGRETLTDTRTFESRPDIPYSASLITPEWRIEESLRLRLVELGGAVEFDTALDSFEQTDQGVSAVIVKGGVAETITAGWLAGCDGGHSVVRRRAGIDFVGETREEMRMIVADVRVDGLDRDAWHVWRHEEGMFSLCPLPSTDAFQYQASVVPGQDPGLGLENLAAILERRSGRTDMRLREATWTSLWRANIRLVDRYREGRVFLAGDAAHIHSPAGGQGMNTGIQDAHNLGWKLAAVVRGAPEQLLDSYDAERRPVGAGVLALSNARLEQTIAQRAPVVKGDANTMQLTIGYRDSAWVRDDRDDTASLRAGDRAPDATGLATPQGRCRLFDLTRGGHFTMLCFGDMRGIDLAPVDLRTFRVVEEPSEPDEIADTAGYLADFYGAGKSTVIVVRPDGYIGLISDTGDMSAVREYFAALG